MPPMEKMKKYYNNFLRVQDTIGLRQISLIAGATAFWFFLSLVPIVILAVSILPYTSLTEEQLLAFISPVVPGSVNELIGIIVADVYKSNLAILSVSIVATIWSAARGFAMLIRGLEEVYEQKEPSGYFKRRARGMVYTVAMLVFMLLTIVIGGFGRELMELVEKYFPATRSIFTFLLQFRTPVVVAVLTVFFNAIYTWGTGTRLRIRQVWPGAVFSAVGWTLLTWVFSVWISGSYGTYGSLATVVIVMLWLYYAQYVLLLGACLNRALSMGISELWNYREDTE